VHNLLLQGLIISLALSRISNSGCFLLLFDFFGGAVDHVYGFSDLLLGGGLLVLVNTQLG